jgi:methionine-rich copper-binding protein CopC
MSTRSTDVSRHVRTLLATILTICAMAASATLPVYAHAQYASSTPLANSTLNAAPSTVTVTWTQELASIQFTITGPDGSNVVSGKPQIDLEHRTNASVRMHSVGPGVYTVLWHNVSGDDGDPNDGSFVFTVTGAVSGAGTAPAAPNQAPGPTSPQPAPAAATATRPVTCTDNGVITPGIADFRVNTYCKRQVIRDQYKGKINEMVFNFDLSIGMGLESSLKDAMGQGG